MACSSPLIIALDHPDMQSALAIANRLDPSLCRLKIGKELFTSVGPLIVEKLQNKGFEIFLDLKFHDIPNTTSKAVKAAAELGVWMVNVHASGGRRMMEACRDILENSTLDRKPLLIAVTVLTSMSEHDLAELGLDSADKQVLKLATLAQQSGMDGVVCSAMETSLLKSELGSNFQLITPGIRPIGAEQGDQCRIVTPAQALQNGSDYLVIGRPVTQADDPVAVLNAILVNL